MSEFETDPPLPERLVTEIALGVQPAELSSGQRDRMRREILTRAQGAPSSASARGTTTNSEWVKIGPCIEVQELWRDEQGRMHLSLIRMQPGGVIPSHGHTQPEELFVLQGECKIGARVLRAGDVFEAPIASVHEDVTTASGVTVLLRGEYPYPAPI